MSKLAEEIARSLWNLWRGENRDPDANHEDGVSLIDQKLSGVREGLRQIDKEHTRSPDLGVVVLKMRVKAARLYESLKVDNVLETKE